MGVHEIFRAAENGKRFVLHRNTLGTTHLASLAGRGEQNRESKRMSHQLALIYQDNCDAKERGCDEIVADWMV
jgi:hypothetical protein